MTVTFTNSADDGGGRSKSINVTIDGTTMSLKQWGRGPYGGDPNNYRRIGFTNTAGDWIMMAEQTGSLYTNNYGFLQNYFLWNIDPSAVRANMAVGGDSPGETANVINCYGSGNVTYYEFQLLKNNGTLSIRAVRSYTNCDCDCVTNCDC